MKKDRSKYSEKWSELSQPRECHCSKRLCVVYALENGKGEREREREREGGREGGR